VCAFVKIKKKEWSFIEAEVSESTTSTAPEVLLPLQHLTTSLEMAAHYYLMRALTPKAIEVRSRPQRGARQLR
jgi:hypothetical protein